MGDGICEKGKVTEKGILTFSQDGVGLRITMKTNKLVGYAVLGLALCGVAAGEKSCENPAPKTVKVYNVPSDVSSPEKLTRFKVERFGSFDAGYTDTKREILVITDNVTHQEYLAVTDVGICSIIKKKRDNDD